MLKVIDSVKKYTVKLTNNEFDDVIGYNPNERKYFTIENNDVIYKRLRDETDIQYYPRLGPRVEFGMGDIVLEEGIDRFLFYIIDRMYKSDRAEFFDVREAIEHLINYYVKYEVADADALRNIFYETLGLERKQTFGTAKVRVENK